MCALQDHYLIQFQVKPLELKMYQNPKAELHYCFGLFFYSYFINNLMQITSLDLVVVAVFPFIMANDPASNTLIAVG